MLGLVVTFYTNLIYSQVCFVIGISPVTSLILFFARLKFMFFYSWRAYERQRYVFLWLFSPCSWQPISFFGLSRVEYGNYNLQLNRLLYLQSFPLSLLDLCPFFNPHIRQEHQRTLRMLLMIPLSVIDSTPAIKKYLEKVRNTIAFSCLPLDLFNSSIWFPSSSTITTRSIRRARRRKTISCRALKNPCSKPLSGWLPSNNETICYLFAIHNDMKRTSTGHNNEMYLFSFLLRFPFLLLCSFLLSFPISFPFPSFSVFRSTGRPMNRCS